MERGSYATKFNEREKGKEKTVNHQLICISICDPKRKHASRAYSLVINSEAVEQGIWNSNTTSDDY